MFEELLNLGLQAAQAAGEITLSVFSKAAVQEKEINNLVTQADIDAENEITRRIHARFSDDAVLGEEGGQQVSLDSDRLWIIDPLDGTNNYAHGIPHYSISIAFSMKGRVVLGIVYDPMRREMFHAVEGKGAFCNGQPIRVSGLTDLKRAMVVTGFYYDRGELMERTMDSIRRLLRRNIQDIRRTGSAALDLCWVASGRFDAYFEYKLSPWDFAAGMLIAREAGGVVVDRYGQECRLNSSGVVASTPVVLPEFLDVIRWRD